MKNLEYKIDLFDRRLVELHSQERINQPVTIAQPATRPWDPPRPKVVLL